MRILFDDNMPYGDVLFPELGDASPFNHATLTPECLHDAAVLLVRSTTRVDADLLSQARKLKFVATATAGINHLDTELLEQRGIYWGHAGGCNATAVAEYVTSALFALYSAQPGNLSTITVGIVGAGHVGTRVSEKLDALGIGYKLCDPPLERSGDTREFDSLDEIMNCDVITLHVPLTRQGDDATWHMFNGERLASLKPHQTLINAARGEVMDNQAALALFEEGRRLNLVVDVWENEPDILLPLVNHTRLATAHIAGHTLEGKARGTSMLYEQLCAWMSQPAKTRLDALLPKLEQPVEELSASCDLGLIRDLVFSMYDIREDSKVFKENITGPDIFSYIRKNYAIRREFAARKVYAGNSKKSQAIYKLGFSKAD